MKNLKKEVEATSAPQKGSFFQRCLHHAFVGSCDDIYSVDKAITQPKVDFYKRSNA